jgi:DNA-3-methyladenine glycosylase
MNSLRDILGHDVVQAAKALIGATLVRGTMRARIVETEAYRHDDPACHAFGKQKMKNMALFGTPGTAYIYLAYGNHWMLNVVAHASGDPAAVLIRAAEPLEGLDEFRRNRSTDDHSLLSGPGKLARAFGIDMSENGRDLLTSEGLHIETAGCGNQRIVATPRIGIREGKWHDVPWRFLDADRLEWTSSRR